LTLQIYRLIKARDLTQAEAGEILGIRQPHAWTLSGLLITLRRTRTRNEHGECP